MAHRVYVVDPATQSPVRAERVSFHDIGVAERQDLQRWIAKDPGLLGEPLLVVSSEFRRADRSLRRLDILALDLKCNLVVIELKLDAGGSLADQQAIRYAALCSDMTMDDVVVELARFEGCTSEDSGERIRVFLNTSVLPALGSRPRIILAAGNIEDHELRSCVLWLRGFGMDISCVEIAPYRASDLPQVILVPRTVIPASEIADAGAPDLYDAHLSGKQIRSRFWRALADEFNQLGTVFRASGNVSGVHLRLRIGFPDIHYEWIVRRRASFMDVALHFESGDRDENMRRLGSIELDRWLISDGVPFEFEMLPWGRRWAEARFRMPYRGRFPGPGLARQAAILMKLLIDRTWPLLESPAEPNEGPPRREVSPHSVSLLARSARMTPPDTRD